MSFFLCSLPLHSLQTLVSWISNKHVLHIKKTAYKVKTNLSQYAEEYCNGLSMLAIAKAANYPPFLTARLLLEHLTNLTPKALTQAVKNPLVHLQDASILKKEFARSEEDPPTRLAREVDAAVRCDPLHGPRHNAARRLIGIEYEVVLERQLASIGMLRCCILFCGQSVGLWIFRDVLITFSPPSQAFLLNPKPTYAPGGRHERPIFCCVHRWLF